MSSLVFTTGEANKFGLSGLTPSRQKSVAPPRVLECPVQMGGIVHDLRPFGKNVNANAFEVHITKPHVDESLLVAGNHETRPHIDPTRWRPLMMSFCRFFDIGLSFINPSLQIPIT